MVYQFWWFTCVGYYRRRNHHRSLEWAIQKEKEWDLIKPKDEDEYGDEEEEEVPAEAAAGGDAEEDEEWFWLLICAQDLHSAVQVWLPRE